MSDAQTRLIPANTTLLQPGSRFFRVVDALNYSAQSLLASNSQQSQTIANMQTQINTLQSQVAALQAQLDGVSFGAVVGAAPPAAAINRIDVTINSVGYSLPLYAP